MRLIRRLAQWLRLGASDADLAEELSFHRETIERDLIAHGHSPVEARDEVRRAMGNETLSREASRGVWLWPSLEAVWQDVRFTVRGLRRNPAFAAGVMLAFALGVGANAVSAVSVNAHLCPPTPYFSPLVINEGF
jgi:putative ABC transport system permease protein